MDIHVIKTSDINQEELNKLCLFINSERRHEVEKQINREDRVRTLVGEGLIRKIIAEKFKINRRDIQIRKNQHGKPYLENYPDFHFNIAHSGGYVLCAIDNKPIGIDVEEIRSIEYEKIAKSFFTSRELDYIHNGASKFQLNRFFEIWTLKESYIKCSGEGLSMPLKSFSIEVENCENIKVLRNNEYKEHSFKMLDIETGYKAAVCFAL